MFERHPISSEPWQYTLSPKESRSWNMADQERRRELLEDLAGRVMCDAVEHGCNRFVIYDADGGLVAKGKLRPGDIEQAIESYRAQNRLN